MKNLPVCTTNDTSNYRIKALTAGVLLTLFLTLFHLPPTLLAAEFSPTLIDASTNRTAPAGSYLQNLEPLENAQFFITPENDHSPLVSVLSRAKKTIHVGIFGISSKLMADTLIQAKNRGVRVQVICDQYCTNNANRLELFNKIKEAGVEIVVATTGFTITHWKMFVVDESIGFISTMNWITRVNQMRDMGVFFTNPKMIQEILKVFNADLENATNQTKITPELSHPNLLWSPINAESKLVELIRSANSTVEIWIENMGQRQIHAALKAAVVRGVKVRVLTSQCGMGMSGVPAFDNLKDLASGGIQVNVMPYPATSNKPYIHAKAIIVDRKNIYLGSQNFSGNSINKARELGLIFSETDIEIKMSTIFEQDWAESISLPASPPETCQPLLGVAF